MRALERLCRLLMPQKGRRGRRRPRRVAATTPVATTATIPAGVAPISLTNPYPWQETR
ncbi:hypothetical protein FHR32_005080 [Streptosporangium album]|uniref:Uncharacterized protein n=1 Tax=Streptosporangium album TaxID=47479 RepID=A0A7W7RZZ5_9ACTN|nr:hypothetical protein [Streptosporangium album]